MKPIHILPLLLLLVCTPAARGQITQTNEPTDAAMGLIFWETEEIPNNSTFKTTLTRKKIHYIAEGCLYFHLSERTTVTFKFTKVTTADASIRPNAGLHHINSDGSLIFRIFDIFTFPNLTDQVKTQTLEEGHYKVFFDALLPPKPPLVIPDPHAFTKLNLYASVESDLYASTELILVAGNGGGSSGGGNDEDEDEDTDPIGGNIFAGLNPSSDQNYIVTSIPLTGKPTLNHSKDPVVTTVQYFDGLGRPTQTVQVGITPSGADLVSYQQYDGFGRESSAWLPVVAASNKGAFVAPATIPTKASATYSGETKPYGKPVYESSPLNRVIQQYGPGQAWHNNGKAVNAEYLTNNSTYPCRLYKVTDSGSSMSLIRASGAAGDYAANQLYVTKLTDESGNISYEFKDKFGQIVLTRQMDGTTPHDTYYIYDDYGNQRAVLPPLLIDKLATGTWGETHADVAQLAYLYKYDERNRCIARKLPGAGWTYYIYDRADRLIFTQDPEQRLQGEWVFTIPDAFGRTVLTGICKQINGNSSITNSRFKDLLIRADFSLSGAIRGYNVKSDGNNMVIGSPHILSANYYDTYEFLSLTGFSSLGYQIPLNGYGTRYAASAKTLLTGTFTGDAARGGTTALYSALYYDNRARLIQSQSTNQIGGKETEYISYTFTGKPQARMLVHTGRTTQTEYYTYTYDHAERLIEAKHKLNTGADVSLAKNTYDELGRLSKSVKNARTDLTDTYTYNIRSWMTTLRSNHLHEDLTYDYNGNVKSMGWTTAAQTRKYDFAYDGLSRLKNATYTGIGNEKYGTAYRYDKHGNITYLERYGKIAAGTAASSYGLIDQLTMNYAGNQLTGVVEAARNVTLPESGDFKKYSSTSIGYTYNQNGAMAKDLNKGISSITYNCLSLPQIIDIKSPVAEGRNEYQYASDGTKLKVVQRWNPSYSTSPVIGSAVNVGSMTKSKTTEYVGNKIYEKVDNGTPTLKRILTDGGYIESGVYHFYVRDHLGNNRVVLTASGGVVQRNHYYPFGMMFAETPAGEQGKQPYQYNGKELDRLHGLNMYDYSARQMEPALGRFTTVDPMAEKYYSISPYAYVGNNPMRYIDPTGMFLTGYTVDEDGNVMEVNDEGGDEYDVLYEADSYSEESRKNYDETGDESGLKISKGIIKLKGNSVIAPYVDQDGKPTGEVAVTHIYKVQSDKESLTIMKFLGRKTNVEWGNVLLKRPDGNTLNVLMTSHQFDRINMGTFIKNRYFKEGYSLVRDDHTHPDSSSPNPSDGDGDLKVKNMLLTRPSNKEAVFRILFKGEYYKY